MSGSATADRPSAGSASMRKPQPRARPSHGRDDLGLPGKSRNPGGHAMPRMELDPSHIMQVGMGFWASKTVLSAVELELFTRLGDQSMTGDQLGKQTGLHPRAIADF